MQKQRTKNIPHIAPAPIARPTVPPEAEACIKEIEAQCRVIREALGRANLRYCLVGDSSEFPH